MADLAALEALKEECLRCTRCPLAQTRTRVVFGDGNPQAPLVIVGEGPGEQEDLTGVPFVGRAGKLLDRVLLENALTRRWIYVCNTVKCRACEVNGTHKRNRAPLPAELQACRPWLDQQLALVRPAVILCLGVPAANSLIHKEFRITQERGRWFTETPYAPWVMASWHPAYILRQAGDTYARCRAELVADIDQCRKKVIELRQHGDLLARQAPQPPVPAPESNPGLGLF
ncbi:MAG: uracil-DNA glycosylase [Armatimonadetes bacterium]|nr:uracil-DNA glycosylase [Armatimonadota bacterium]